MAVLTPEAMSIAGLVPTMAAATAGGDLLTNNGRTMLVVTNGGGGSITVTVTAVRACNKGSLHNGGGAVAAGATKTFGPFATGDFNNASGQAAITYSGVTSVTVGSYTL